VSSGEPLAVSDPVARMEQKLRLRNKAEMTITRYRQVAEEFRRFVGTKKSYTIDDYEAFATYLLTKQKTRGFKETAEISGTYRRFVYYALKRLYKANGWPWYSDEDDKENVPKKNRPKRPWYTYPEIQRILEVAKRSDDLRKYLMLRVGVLAMTRRRSGILLNRWDYDQETGNLTMPQVKGSKPQVIKLDPETNMLMLKYLAGRTDAYPAMFPSFRARNMKGQLSPGTANEFLVDFCKAAGVENKGTHAFRRGMISYFHNELGHDEREIFEMTDHNSRAMIGEYIQLSPGYGERTRETEHPFYAVPKSRRQPVVEGPEVSPKALRKRLQRPTPRDLAET